MKKIVFFITALLLMNSLLLCGCQPAAQTVTAGQNANKLPYNPTADDSITDSGSQAPEIDLIPGTKPDWTLGEWEPVGDQIGIYDLKVTTFNMGQFYHGVGYLDVYGNQVNVNPGILPEYVLGAYEQWKMDLPNLDADILALQEVNPKFYYNSQTKEEITSEEMLGQYFKNVNTLEGTTGNNGNMWNSIVAGGNSKYELNNVTSGYLCADDSTICCFYVKGYVTVAGKDIAVYSLQMQPNDGGGAGARTKAFRELAELMSKEEYAIAMGDMNVEGASEYELMKSYGFNMANTSVFGSFNTYEYSSNAYIDNIFTTDNIEIVAVECEADLCGGSDHYPLSAYLKILDQKHNCGDPTTVGSDGFVEGWYKP